MVLTLKVSALFKLNLTKFISTNIILLEICFNPNQDKIYCLI